MSAMLQTNTQQNDQDAFDAWFDERLEMKLTEREEVSPGPEIRVRFAAWDRRRRLIPTIIYKSKFGEHA